MSITPQPSWWSIWSRERLYQRSSVTSKRLRKTASSSPDAAVKELFSFSVLDPACGSAHFLVQVVETLADMTVRFLAETPLPGISDDLDRLRSGTSVGTGVDDAALVRRLVLKHCVFGVDVSPMGAEIALMSLWLASFVPGLSLSYLDRNVIVGDSLLGVFVAGDGREPRNYLV